MDLFKWCLSFTYFIGRLTGVINFEIDLKTGRGKITKRATISAACSHIVISTMMAFYVINIDRIVKLWRMSSYLQKYVVIVFGFFRIACVFLFFKRIWSDRRKFMKLFDSLRRQYSPEIIPFCRKTIFKKSFCFLMLHTALIIIILTVMLGHARTTLDLAILGNFIVLVVTNVIILQYFIAMVGIRGRYILLIKEFQAIISEIRSLNPNRIGVFVTTCCSLADRLEKLAQSQSDLQALMERLSRSYQVQVVNLIITYYSNLVSFLLVLFTLNKHGASTEVYHKFVTILHFAIAGFWLIDFRINASSMFCLLDTHDKMVQLLSQRTSFQPGLDRRLEAVVRKEIEKFLSF
ncbi:putative gustatory receptor 59d [Drosophila biarmipes]|uniref:putative gustatory receptor 59d n=1 Tax=Drosophila biarmipes TaxID=125945 RepID=UPI0021CC6633|nr:putative gustatory receptor 59d [Drosophila biarmipes]